MSEPAGLGVEVAVISSDAAIITVCGELDADTGLALQHQLAGQVVHGRRHLVLDLADVPFMDSSGLRVIVRTSTTCGTSTDPYPWPRPAKCCDVCST